MLMHNHNMKRMGSALKFLMLHTPDGEEFLESIVAGD
jgi:hypothetical protein